MGKLPWSFHTPQCLKMDDGAPRSRTEIQMPKPHKLARSKLFCWLRGLTHYTKYPKQNRQSVSHQPPQGEHATEVLRGTGSLAKKEPQIIVIHDWNEQNLRNEHLQRCSWHVPATGRQLFRCSCHQSESVSTFSNIRFLPLEITWAMDKNLSTATGPTKHGMPAVIPLNALAGQSSQSPWSYSEKAMTISVALRLTKKETCHRGLWSFATSPRLCKSFTLLHP